MKKFSSAPNGALDALKRGSLFIDSSTISPELARRESEECADRGIDFLDAPVTGGTWGAEKGELVFMIGGKQEVFDRAKPVLEAMGKKSFPVRSERRRPNRKASHESDSRARSRSSGRSHGARHHIPEYQAKS